MALYYPDLTTLEALKRLRDIKSDLVTDDARLVEYIHQASGIVQTGAGRTFVPYRAVRRYDARGYYVSATLLDLDEDLLEIETLTNGDDTVIPSTDYILRQSNEFPKWRIELLNSRPSVFTYQDDWQQAIQVDGWWGFVPHYTTAFVSTGMTIEEDVDNSETLIDVSDARRVDVLDYLRIGSGDEIIQVTAKNTTANPNTITVLRAQLGTTAETYTDGASVTAYQQNSEIELAATRIAGFLYDHRDTLDNYVQVGENNAILDSRFPPQVTQVIQNFRRPVLRTMPSAPYRGLGNF